jgi:predicted short-subunit dehydrogenase-like oxidoreductase (DUF2520 family)
MTRVGLIGAGRLGSCLGLALAKAGADLVAIASRHAPDANAVCARIQRGAAVSDHEVAQQCDLVFLAVPDAAIASVASSIAWRPGQAVVHCSGASSLDALNAASERGALRGCLHPLQTFPERFADPERFRDIHCGVEADGPLLAELESLCTALGATPLPLSGVDRAGYHAAAVFASNYVVALHAAAEQIWGLAGLDRQLARPALAPLTLEAARKIGQLPLAAALTGPLARGDADTVQGHLRALRALPGLHDLYLGLAQRLLELPLALSDAERARIAAALARPPAEPSDA